MVKLIGFSGGYGVGKSTAIECLKEIAQQVRLVKFAQPLYDMQGFIYERIARAYVPGPDFIKDRKLLQWLGTDWGRNIDENLWVNIWKEEARRHLGHGAFIVCDDVRFDNEAETVRAMGGLVVKLTRPNNDKHAQGGTGIANHASEAGVRADLVNHTIANDGTLESFKTSLRKLYQQLATQSE